MLRVNCRDGEVRAADEEREQVQVAGCAFRGVVVFALPVEYVDVRSISGEPEAGVVDPKDVEAHDGADAEVIVEEVIDVVVERGHRFFVVIEARCVAVLQGEAVRCYRCRCRWVA